MVGPEAEHEGIIRSGARFVEAMATARVPKVVLTVNHASGAGYYAMAGQGFDPDFIFSWPTGRMGVMEGESAVQAVHGPAIDKARKAGAPVPPEVQASIEEMRADYEQQLDARFAAARGFVDAIVHPGGDAHGARNGAARGAPEPGAAPRRLRSLTAFP
jgi:acetyl-CoA carboxylase carboxyltransferase component